MVTPAVKRQTVAHLCKTYEVSQRRACRSVGCDRMTVRYRSRRPGDPLLRERLRALAHERRRFGYRRLHIVLKREGFVVKASSAFAGSTAFGGSSTFFNFRDNSASLSPSPPGDDPVEFTGDTLAAEREVSHGRKAFPGADIVDRQDAESAAAGQLVGHEVQGPQIVRPSWHPPSERK